MRPVQLLEWKTEKKEFVRLINRNQSLILGIPGILPRLLKLLHLNSLVSWAQRILSQISSSAPDLIQAVLARSESSNPEEDWNSIPTFGSSSSGGEAEVGSQCMFLWVSCLPVGCLV